MERMEDKQGEGGSFTEQSWQNLWERDNQQSKAAKEVVLAAGAPQQKDGWSDDDDDDDDDYSIVK